MFPVEYLWFPRHGHEKGVDSAADWSGKDVANLQANKESKGNNDRSKTAIRVVGRIRKDQVEEGHQSTCIADKGGAHTEHRSNETLVDQGINTALLDHVPGILGRGNICLAVQGNVRESISIQKRDGPVQESNEAPQNAEHNGTNDISLASLALSGD